MSQTVVSHDRVRWRVGRRWLPFRLRLPRGDWRDMRSGDAADLDFFDEPGGILAGLAIIATAMLLFLVVWPVIAIAVELTLLALVLVAAVAGRVLLRRPWTVFARSEGAGPAQEHTWQVVGWRRSDRLIEDVIRSLEKGTSCPPGAQTVGPSPRALPGPRDGAT